jgi:5-methyltetrahydrofolate corrinoid/iron sulfur protein methyltransferase
MQVIGERLNGMFRDVGKAIVEQDKGVIQDLAQRQLEAGAHILDLNVGPTAEDAIGAMKWLIETTREVTDCPLAIDSTKADVVRTGVEMVGSKAMINSSPGDEESLDRLMPLAAEHDCDIICLTIDKEIAMRAVEKAMLTGVDLQRVYIDPVIIPCNVPDAGHHPGAVLETIRQIKLFSDPPPKTTLGLSNVSQGTSQRHLINRTYLVMCMTAGLDSAIMDPLDTDLMDAAITTDLLLNRTVYCDDFLRAHRK